MGNELKPCPFCGGDNIQAIQYTQGITLALVCVKCGARGPKQIVGLPTMDGIDTTEAWNTRAALAASDEEAVDARFSVVAETIQNNTGCSDSDAVHAAMAVDSIYAYPVKPAAQSGGGGCEPTES